MSDMVSVIICTHNRKNMVSRAIDSALSQKYCNFEIFVVDDCSEDGTVDFLKEKYFERIKILSTEKNSGRAVASNLGFNYSKGKYVALLDDDDYWIDNNKLKKQIDMMRSQPSLGVLGTWWIELKSNGVEVEKKPLVPKSRYLLVEKLLMGGGVVSGSSPLIRREAWENIGGMDTKQVKGIDSDLYRRILLAGYDIDVLNEVTTVADVAHDFDRMTTASHVKGKIKQLHGNFQVLSKHFIIYLFYPRALFVRFYKIFRALIDLCKEIFIKAKFFKSYL